MDGTNAMAEDPAPEAVAATPAVVEVSEQDLETCLRVLQAFHGDAGFAEFQQPRFKPLRQALLPLHAELRGKFFHGKAAADDSKRQEKKRKLMVERARQKALDHQFINNTKLRAERIARLESLTAANPLLAQVPDGAVSSDAPKLLTAAEQQQTETEAEDQLMEDADAAELHHHRACYTCKLKFKTLHHFYDRLCPSCAQLNYEKRMQQAKLDGHVAVVTGARVKIGYEICLKLLRSGATVIATTRFPKDAAYRYARETDFEDWKHRLQIYGMDFRDLGVIDRFMDHVEATYGSMDILINNATQTIRRPTHYYKHLIAAEVAPVPEEMASANEILRGNANLLRASPSSAAEASSSETNALVKASTSSTLATAAATPSSVLLSQVAVLPEDQESADTASAFPTAQVDVNNQQIDLRTSNSWVLKLNQIETMELVEVFAINTMAPFILNKRAITLLEKSQHEHKFIINVSAMEGKFYRVKSPNHPHTNMAKAAVNMMTRTCAEDLAKRGIFMNSVDTGWINDENPRDVAVRIAASHNFQTPLDEIDAAARVLDPIFVLHQQSNTQPPIFGKFLKDFKISEW